MCRIKIGLMALAMSLFLAGCGNSADDRSGISNTDTPPVSEPVSVPENSEKIESAISTASDKYETNTPDNTSNNSSDTTYSETGEPSESEPLQNTSSQSSDKSESSSTADTNPETPTETIPEANEMTITVNGKEFSAKFHDTKAAEEFKAMLPLTLDMSELNGNEKYIYLDDRFTTASESVGHINSGDIMLYGSNCVVLFYDSFNTPYSYTRIGYINDPDGLKNAVGRGGVTVEFR